jgi:hypothetical protein
VVVLQVLLEHTQGVQVVPVAVVLIPEWVERQQQAQYKVTQAGPVLGLILLHKQEAAAVQVRQVQRLLERLAVRVVMVYLVQ